MEDEGMVQSLFLAHGAPTLALEENAYTRFLEELGRKMGKPDAVVIFTAHWISPVLSVTYRDDAYETIHDFGGFQEELYEMEYPAKGSTETASRLKNIFEQAGIPVKLDSSRGLDHGSWVVLRRMYPAADIPVVQVSVNPALPVKEQYFIGECIRQLREKDILLIGSGGTVHNLFSIEWGRRTPVSWAVEFDDWLVEKVLAKDLDALFHYDQYAPHARRAVPTPEHFIPLFIAMGSGERETPELLHRSYDFGSLSHICFSF